MSASSDTPRYHWQKLTGFDPVPQKTEEWIFHSAAGVERFPVSVTLGKEIDLGSIKKRSPSKGELESVTKMRDYFEKLDGFVNVSECPICKSSIGEATPLSKAWKAVYHRCRHCSHVYTNLAPSDQALSTYYEDTTVSSDYYIRPEEIQLRIDQIYRPKLEWCIREYTRIYGRRPESMLDLGAGSGHFLRACVDAGIKADGLEINKAYQHWAKKNLGVELAASLDDLRAKKMRYDLVTSFNTIEHIPAPSDFLATYDEFASDQSLSIMETPRFDSLGIWVERTFTNRIKGILIPYLHVQLFTDSSMATLLASRGFAPVSAWFFGQDAKDLFFQIGEELGQDGDEACFRFFGELQRGIDLLNAGNLMIFAAVPPRSRAHLRTIRS